MRTKILILGLICSLMLSPVLNAEKKKRTNSWREFFTEPIEVAYVIMKDERYFKMTDYDQREIYTRISDIKKELKKHDYEIKDIAIFIHNHFKRAEFSSRDLKTYRRLKKYGFNGRFLLYCLRNNKLYSLEEKQKST